MSRYGFQANAGKRARVYSGPYRNRAPRSSRRTSAYVRSAYRPRANGRRYPVKGAIAPYGGRKELKYVDTAAASYVCDTTGTVTCLNLIAVGDDNTTRDGRQTTIKSVQLRGIVHPLDTTTNDTYARVMLVWDNANNSGAIATIAQILTAATSLSFPLIDNSNRFTILSDQTFPVGLLNNTATQAVSNSPNDHLVDLYKKINQVTQYSGTTAAIGSIQNGALLMVTLGNQAAGGGAVAQIATRVRFCDD